MSVSRAPTAGSAQPAARLSSKARLALISGTDLKSEDVLNMQDELLTTDFFLRHGIGPVQFAASGIDVAALVARGAADPSHLKELGFDCLHLTDLNVTEACIAQWGAISVLDALFRTPADAVALAGSEALHTLGVTTDALLAACAGSAVESAAVLKLQGSLTGVFSQTLLDSGLRAPQFTQLGYSASDIARATNATAHDLRKLGF